MTRLGRAALLAAVRRPRAAKWCPPSRMPICRLSGMLGRVGTSCRRRKVIPVEFLGIAATNDGSEVSARSGPIFDKEYTFATVDQVSNGRMTVHFITGGTDHEQQREGDYLTKDERYERTRECKQIVKRGPGQAAQRRSRRRLVPFPRTSSMRWIRCDAAARNTGAEDTFGSRCCWRIQAPSKPSRSPYSNSRSVLSSPVRGPRR